MLLTTEMLLVGIALSTTVSVLAIFGYRWMFGSSIPAKLLVYAFLGGCASVLLVVVALIAIFPIVSENNTLYVVFGAPIVEEISKAAFALLVIRSLPKVSDQIITHISRISPVVRIRDFVLLGMVLGLGFAFVEDVMYFTSYGIGVLILRLLLLMISHGLFTGYFAWAYARNKSNFVIGIVPAIMLHVGWNGSLVMFGIFEAPAWSFLVLSLVYIIPLVVMIVLLNQRFEKYDLGYDDEEGALELIEKL